MLEDVPNIPKISKREKVKTYIRGMMENAGNSYLYIKVILNYEMQINFTLVRHIKRPVG